MSSRPQDRSAGPIPQWLEHDGVLRDTGEVYPFPVNASNIPKDAFDRLRISEPVTLFDSQNQYDASPLFWETITAGSGSETHQANESVVDLDVTAASGDKVTRQTKAYFRYQPGKSHLALITFAFGTGQENTQKRAGYFDDANGFFLQEENGAVSVVKRSSVTGSPVDTEVAQASWNADPLDGTGESGYTLNPALSQILFIAAEWLGVGTVSMGFFIDGAPVVVHRFHHANRTGNTTTYTTTHNLPVRYEIENTGAAAGTSTFKTICCSVISEGGFEEDRGVPFSTALGATPVPVSARRPVLSIQPKLSFNSVTNRGQIFIDSVDAMSLGNPSFVELVYDGSLSGASFASADLSSIVNRDVDATTIAGGIVIDSFYVPGGSAAQGGPGSKGKAVSNKLPLVVDFSASSAATISVVITNISATSSALASLGWREYR